MRTTTPLVLLGERVCSLNREKAAKLAEALEAASRKEGLSRAIESIRDNVGDEGLCLIALAYLIDRLADAIVESITRYYERSHLLKTGLPPLYGEFRFEVFEKLVSVREGPFEPYIRKARLKLHGPWRLSEEVMMLEPLSLDHTVGLAFDRAFAGLWKLADCAICWLLGDERLLTKITGAVTISLSKHMYAQRLKEVELSYGTTEPLWSRARAPVPPGELKLMIEELIEEACYRCKARGP